MHRDAPLFVLTLSFFGRVVERSEKPECIFDTPPNGLRMDVSGRTCVIGFFKLHRHYPLRLKARPPGQGDS